MFVIFYDGEFVDFWFNNSNDEQWIERTAKSMKWDLEKVDVYQYERPLPEDSGHRFLENKDIEVLENDDVLETLTATTVMSQGEFQ